MSAGIVHKVAGPPGCGKTTWGASYVARAVQKFGPRGALVMSLTRAAAAEAGGRNTGLEKGCTGTIHALCYHALGRPEIINKDAVEAWNADYPSWAMTPEGADIEGEDAPRLSEAARAGDELARDCEMMRARMSSPLTWPAEMQSFHAAWSAWKRAHDVCDFTDLIERAKNELATAPGAPPVIIIDEAQDMSYLELGLVLDWARSADHTFIVGDEQQSLYGWRGASPDIMKGELFKVLDQSFRVPRAVHARAMRIIKASGTWRDDTVYHPRRVEPGGAFVEGQVDYAGDITWQRPEGILARVETGEPLMILAPCDYMLGPTKAVLRQAGYSWHNPFSRRYAALSEKSRLTVNAMEYLGRPGSVALGAAQLKLIAAVLRGDDAEAGIRRGGKAAIQRLPDAAPVMEVAKAASQWLAPGAYDAMDRGDLGWFLQNLPDSASPALELALRVALKGGGAEALNRPPSVILGTIHSVKGGECPNVLMYPDLSAAGYNQMRLEDWNGRGAIFRMFYVGATRASERLTIAKPVSGFSVPLMQL